MARITVEDCLKVVDNRFELIHLAAKRSRQLAYNGYDDVMIEAAKKHKPTVMALREIAAGYTHFDHHSLMGTDQINEEDSGDADPFLPGFEASAQAKDEASEA